MKVYKNDFVAQSCCRGVYAPKKWLQIRSNVALQSPELQKEEAENIIKGLGEMQEHSHAHNSVWHLPFQMDVLRQNFLPGILATWKRDVGISGIPLSVRNKKKQSGKFHGSFGISGVSGSKNVTEHILKNM